MKSSAQETLEFAMEVRAAAKAIRDLLERHFKEMSQADRHHLRAIDVALMNSAADLATSAVDLAVDNGQASLAEMSITVKRAKDAFCSINDVKKTVDVASSLLAFVKALPMGDVPTLWASFRHLQASTPDSRPP